MSWAFCEVGAYIAAKNWLVGVERLTAVVVCWRPSLIRLTIGCSLREVAAVAESNSALRSKPDQLRIDIFCQVRHLIPRVPGKGILPDFLTAMLQVLIQIGLEIPYEGAG